VARRAVSDWRFHCAEAGAEYNSNTSGRAAPLGLMRAPQDAESTRDHARASRLPRTDEDTQDRLNSGFVWMSFLDAESWMAYY